MAEPDAPDDGALAEAHGRHRRWSGWASAALGAAYGLFARLVFGVDRFDGLFGVMTTTFLFVVPVVVGFVTVYTLPGGTPRWRTAATLPWGAAMLTVAAAGLLAWEGLICIVVWLPAFLALTSVGGLMAAGVRRMRETRSPFVLASAVLLPLVLAPLENTVPAPARLHTLEDRIVIDAPAAVVWAQIREVAPISPAELGPSFAYRIGFPRPVEAQLVGTGVGSVRYATFDGGVTFTERVTEWDENRALAFTIDASAVPSTTFDEHVAVGGHYFDVLDGRYTIRPLDPGRTELSLVSTHRLSTRFNAYTRFWTDLFMRDIQQTILGVIRARSERAAG